MTRRHVHLDQHQIDGFDIEARALAERLYSRAVVEQQSITPAAHAGAATAAADVFCDAAAQWASAPEDRWLRWFRLAADIFVRLVLGESQGSTTAQLAHRALAAADTFMDLDSRWSLSMPCFCEANR